MYLLLLLFLQILVLVGFIQKQDEYYRSIDRLCIRILEFLFVYDKLDCRSAGTKVHFNHGRLICEKLFLGREKLICILHLADNKC